MEQSTIQAGEFTLRMYTAGDKGSPVVLLHGGGTDSALLSWKEAIGPLAGSHRVYAPDWPGFGESPKASAACTQETLLRCLEAFIDSLKLKQVSLVGLSMGGGAALGCTLSHPERVSRLVLVASYGFQDRFAFYRLTAMSVRMPWMVKWTADATRSSRAMVRWSLASIVKNPGSLTDALVDEVMQIARSTQAIEVFNEFQIDEALPDRLKTCYMDRLGEITCPTLIVHGKEDVAVPVKFAYEAARRIPNAQLEVFSPCGHWVARDQVEKFNQAVGEFLKN